MQQQYQTQNGEEIPPQRAPAILINLPGLLHYLWDWNRADVRHRDWCRKEGKWVCEHMEKVLGVTTVQMANHRIANEPVMCRSRLCSQQDCRCFVCGPWAFADYWDWLSDPAGTSTLFPDLTNKVCPVFSFRSFIILSFALFKKWMCNNEENRCLLFATLPNVPVKVGGCECSLMVQRKTFQHWLWVQQADNWKDFIAVSILDCKSWSRK